MTKIESVADALLHDAELTARIEAANSRVIERFQTANPVLVRIRPAAEVIPGMRETTVLHSGPPLTWARMCPMLQGAIRGGLVFEGLAADVDEAQRLIDSGLIEFRSCNDVGGVAPLAGVVTASMPVFEVEERAFGTSAFAPLNEGMGKVLRFGAVGAEVFDRLRWMRETLGPIIDELVRSANGIPVFEIMSEALHMGDECHNRNKAGTSLFLRKLIPYCALSRRDGLERSVRFVAETDVFFLNVAMAACKAVVRAVEHIEGSSIVTLLSQNGTAFGVKIAGTGPRWFEAPAPVIEGKFLNGYGPEDANPGIGDSLIMEVLGFGGFALAAAPALVQYIGGSPEGVTRLNLEMYGICVGESGRFTIPGLNFRGLPLGIDVRKIVVTRKTPVTNSGIAHKRAGVGQVGAGYIRTPIEPFEAALLALHRTLTS